MFDDEVEYNMNIVDCIISVNQVQKGVELKTTEYLINYLIDIESRMGIDLPDDITEIIDDFYNTPIFNEKSRKNIIGFITLIQSELMVSEEGHIMRTVFA